jgi:diguanylate cyclase (GGDEF)-like protein
MSGNRGSTAGNGAPRQDHAAPWRLLVVSGDPDLYTAAQQAVRRVRDGGHAVELLTARDAAAAERLAADHGEIAVALLDGDVQPDLPEARIVRYHPGDDGLAAALECALRDHEKIVALAVANERLEQLLADRTRQLEEANLILERLATTDPLTGIVNRRRFMDLASREVLRSKRTGAAIAVILLDIDHFHLVNDHHGQATGDAVLLEVVNRIGQGLRTLDVLGRLGGEEFGILLPEAGLEGAGVVAERLRESICATQISAGGDRLTVSASLGVACLSNDETLDGLLHRADDALVAAKQGGRNRVVAA